MKLKISGKGNSRILYVHKSFRDHSGKSTSKIVERLGTLDQVRARSGGKDPIEWAKEYIAKLTVEENEQRIVVCPRLHPDVLIKKGQRHSLNCGYLFIQRLYYKLRIDRICHKIAQDHKHGTSKKKIAEMVGCDLSTIYREIKRNKTKRGRYNHKTAQEYTNERRERNPRNKVPQYVINEALTLLKEEQYSPDQISNYLRKEKGYKISRETIYKIIRADEKMEDLKQYCRHHLKHRKRGITGKAGVKHIPNRTDISERPAEADGKRPWDFEMDTIVGPKNEGAIVTIIERSTNILFMKKLHMGKEAESLADEVIKILFPFREHIKTITTDNGGEFACHEKITKALALKGRKGPTVYFAKPYASWQKGAVENANQLIRQYIPKGVSFDNFTDKDIENIQKKLNRRPRKKLGYISPLVAFSKLLD